MLNEYGDFGKSSLAWLISDEKKQFDNPALLEQNFKNDPNNAVYKLESETVKALKHFQKRNSLNQTGELNSKTLERLNLSPYFMAQRIALNMKRWRYLPKKMGDKYILVNMANFRLDLINQGESEMDMKVIIGREQRRTPVLAETISTVVLAPHWNVPHRIAIRDILPAAKRDETYLARHNFKIYEGWQTPAVEVSQENIDWSGFQSRTNTYRFVQASGDQNSLGNVKFVFPNDKSIYLHDTNHKELFSREMRALSSGCIRVEKPLELAHALLKGQNWNQSLIKDTIGNSQMRPVQLKSPIPVYLMYWTTWVDESGQLQIRDDVYKRDIINGESHKLDSIIL
jgi:murein L,D-transpeptidase YcbB/YkuD